MAQVQIYACQKCKREVLSDINSRNPRKYCDECREIIRVENNRGRYVKKGPFEKRCIVCNRKFVAKTKQKKYCSIVCNVRKLRMVVIRDTCEICNNAFIPQGKRKYCSYRCRRIAYHKNGLKKWGYTNV